MNKIEEENIKLTIIELGAGTAVPTVQNTSDKIAKRFTSSVVRINPRESFGTRIELPMRAVEALDQIIS